VLSTLIALHLLTPLHAEEAVERQLLAMGTVLAVRVEAPDRATALAASEAAVRAIGRVEARLTSRGGTSELARLSAGPVGAWRPLSPELAADLALAERCRAWTRGGFDLTLGAPEALELDGARARALSPIALDAGGIGKGIGLDAGLAAATEAGATVVTLDLGGQIATAGATIEVDLAHPAQRGLAVTTITLEDGSVATSGQGVQPGHIVDPRGPGAVPPWGSVTVVAPSAAQADCLATGLFVLGPQRAADLATAIPGVEVVVQRLVPDGDLP